MDASPSHYKPRRLDTSPSLSNRLPSVIALSPGGDHLAVGCSNGDIFIWRLPLGDDIRASHRVLFPDVHNPGISSVTWVSNTLMVFGRDNGLVGVAKLDYRRGTLSIGTLKADDSFLPIRYISESSQLMLMATVAEDRISVWEWQEQEWTLWKKVRTFPAFNVPAASKVEENPVHITSLHWLRKYRGVKAPLLVSFLHHGVKIIDTTTGQTVYTLPVRVDVGSLSLSKDETVIAINNTHNGFNVYCLPHGDLVGRFVEHDLHATATSSFLDSDEFLVYPGGAGVLKLGEIQSTSSLAFVSGADRDQLRILVVEARSFDGYNNRPTFVTLAQNALLTHTRYITVWECFREAEMVLLEMQKNHHHFSMVASCVAIAGIVATWYLASRSDNVFRGLWFH